MFQEVKQRLQLGKRITPKDKNLVSSFFMHSFFFVFFLSFLLLNIKSIVTFPYSGLSLLNFQTELFANHFNGTYIAVTIAISFILCIVLLILYFIFCKTDLQKKRHRQALARMILENKWYTSETVNSSESGFFKDNMFASKSKERITDYATIYYKFVDSHIVLNVKATMGTYQEQLLKINKKIETGLFCEYVSRTEKEPYYEYVFYYDLEKNRISIDDVTLIDGKLKLMNGFVWDMDKRPHGLVVGGTGSGKSIFLLIFILSCQKVGIKLNIIDPKKSDLAYLKNIMPDVYSDEESIIACLQKYKEDMLQRSEDMQKMDNYRMGANYRDLGLKPNFLIFDEYIAFMTMLEKGKGRTEVDNCMKQIAMLGRQTGFYLLVACQRPDATYFSDGMRDQFHFRLALGRNSELGYNMAFGDTDKEFFDMPAGRGYVDIGTNVISKFYAPFVPDGYDFLEKIEKSYKDNVIKEMENLC